MSSKPQFNNHQDFLAACLSSHLPPERMHAKSICELPEAGWKGGAYEKPDIRTQTRRMYDVRVCDPPSRRQRERIGGKIRPSPAPDTFFHLCSISRSQSEIKITTILGTSLLSLAVVLLVPPGHSPLISASHPRRFGATLLVLIFLLIYQGC